MVGRRNKQLITFFVISVLFYQQKKTVKFQTNVWRDQKNTKVKEKETKQWAFLHYA